MDNSLQNKSQFVDYRNAFYQGGFVKGRRQGKGILITDLGQIFIGTWRNDCLDDRALIWIDEKSYVIGDFNKGQMDGNFIYRDNKSIFYTTFSNDRITGKQLNIDRNQNRAILTQFKNSAYKELENYGIVGMQDEQILAATFGQGVELPTFQTFKEQLMLKDKIYEEKILNNGNRFIYFKKPTTVEKLGFVLLKDQLVSFGVYKDDVLEGLGYQFTNKTKYEGVFKNGLLNGRGLKLELVKGTSNVYQFVQGNITKQLASFNQKGADLTDYKRSIHLRSMYFFNSFVQSRSLLKYHGIHEIINRYHPQQQYLYEQSPTKTQAKRPAPQSKLISNEYVRTPPTDLDNSLSSPTKRSLGSSRKVINNDPSFKGPNSLLDSMQKGRYEGSYEQNIKNFNQIQSMRKKNSRQ